MEQWLLSSVQRQAQLASISMPSVAIYPAPDMNAFATGANRNEALVAVSSGLLTNMSRNEVEAVLAHEVYHIANGDMVTMTLLQGVVNTFVIFISRIIAQAVASTSSNNSDEGQSFSTGTYFTTFFLPFCIQPHKIKNSTVVLFFIIKANLA